MDCGMAAIVYDVSTVVSVHMHGRSLHVGTCWSCAGTA